MRSRPTDGSDELIASVRSTISELRGWYLRLFTITGQDGRSPSAEARGSRAVDPPLPVNVSVLDLISATERGVDDVERFVRRRLYGLGPAMRRDGRNRAAEPRADFRRVPVPTTSRYAARWVWITTGARRPAGGVAPDQRVLDALAWISSVLPDVVERGYAPDVVGPLEKLHGRTRRVLGLSERVYALASTCPFCDLPSVMARPDRGRVVCGNPTCRDDRGRPHEWLTADYLHELTTDEEVDE